jgi:hypothetical protein
VRLSRSACAAIFSTAVSLAACNAVLGNEDRHLGDDDAESGGASGTSNGGTGTAGSSIAGSGTAGSGTAGSGTAGSGTAGTAGTGTAGAAGTGTAGAAGTGTAGAAGTGTAGSAGSGIGGTGTAGSAGAGAGGKAGGGAGGTAGSAGGSAGSAGTGPIGSLPGCTTESKGAPCTNQGVACKKTCGPQSLGWKSETCNSGMIAESPTCEFECTDTSVDWGCYSLAGAPTCNPANIPMASQACTTAPCAPCTGGYLDTSMASKMGDCICAAGKWSCTASTQWPECVP